MSGRWDMRWTTEKEILFLVEKGFFGLKCLSVYQVRDEKNSLDIITMLIAELVRRGHTAGY